MATEQEVTRSIGFAVIRVGKRLPTDEVVFARDDDLQFLGAHLGGIELESRFSKPAIDCI